MKFIIERILIPLDFSETSNLALDHGIYMAKLYNAEIHLLHVHETLLYTAGIDYSMVNLNPRFELEIEKNFEYKLKETAEKLFTQHNIRVKTIQEKGRAYHVIVDTAEKINANLIIMGTHGVSGVQEFFAGSNAFRVATSSPCPVLTLQQHTKEPGFKNIIMPIDDSFASRQKLNHCIELAHKYNAKVHIAGLMTGDDTEFIRKFNLKIEQAEEYLQAHNVSFSTKLIEGENLATMTMDYAKECNGDLIVIMTEQEPNIKALFMGSFAQQVVNHSKIPVLSIRPEVQEYENQSFNPI